MNLLYQIPAYLLAASVIGFILAWVLRGWRIRQLNRDALDMSTQSQSLTAQMEHMKQALEKALLDKQILLSQLQQLQSGT